MLYTRKGDDGTTKAFGCDQRFSKSSIVAEALGALDELNSFLGLVKVKIGEATWQVNGRRPSDVFEWVQNGLFVVQAEVAGASKKATKDMVTETEAMVDALEKQLPPIKSFFISGGTESAALLDVARTLSRKAERRVVAAAEEGKVVVGPETLAFMNRLSSLLYAMARFANHEVDIPEKAPWYN